MKKITARITLGDQTVYINNNIDSAEIESLTKGDLSNIIDYGIYSNKGTLSFFDYNKSFYNLMKSDPTDVKVETFISNPIADKLIGTFLIDDYDYDDSNSLVTLQLKDGLLSWQNIPLPTIYYFRTISLYELVEEIFAEASIQNFIFTESSKHILQNIYVYCTHLVNETVWSAITKVCQASMCRVCLNEQGVPKFYSDSVTTTENIIIRSRNILGIENEIPRKNNKVASGVFTIKQRIKQENKIGSFSLLVNEVREISNGIASGRFVGNDKGINGESTITYISDFNSQYPEYRGVAIIKLKENTYEYNDDFSVLGTIWKVDGATNPQYYTEGNAKVNNIWEEKIFNRNNNTLTLKFLFGGFFIQTIIEKIYTEIEGKYYEDADDIQIYTNPADLTSGDISINSNELMQSRNIWAVEDASTSQYHIWFLEEIKRRFKKGVYCCEMNCLTTDYYDENNDLIINGNRKDGQVDTFEKQDVVVPYVTRNGAEQPYRTTVDGSPIAFTVVGIKYLYNGHLTQKIMLQEQT